MSVYLCIYIYIHIYMYIYMIPPIGKVDSILWHAYRRVKIAFNNGQLTTLAVGVKGGTPCFVVSRLHG